MLRQKQARVSILELGAVFGHILHGRRVGSSVLIHILYCNHVTVSELAIVHTWVQDLLLEFFGWLYLAFLFVHSWASIWNYRLFRTLNNILLLRWKRSFFERFYRRLVYDTVLFHNWSIFDHLHRFYYIQLVFRFNRLHVLRGSYVDILEFRGLICQVWILFTFRKVAKLRL